MIDYFASLFGFGSGGDDGSRRVEAVNGPPNYIPKNWQIDSHLRNRIERGECLPPGDVQSFRAEMENRGRREQIDYRLERCRR
jgi:hypothetical protein